jgi:Na+-transporting methylmalonyl-CoA/oxaloacetate decarboxylase gamma subunit
MPIFDAAWLVVGVPIVLILLVVVIAGAGKFVDRLVVARDAGNRSI